MLDQELPETCPCCGADNADPVTGEWVCDAAAPCCSVACLDVIVQEMREADSAHADALAEEADIAREWRASRAAGGRDRALQVRAVIWSDILPLETRAEARAAIARCVASLRTTAQAAELIGAGRAYELSPGGARWHDLLTDEQLAPWRARIGERMFLRWEAATRQRLIQDALTLARDHLEASALEAGVRLGRSARDTLADALRFET